MRSDRPATNGNPAISVVEPNPDDIERLVALYTSGQLREAETRARQLMETCPEAQVLFDVLAAALSGQGKFEDAANCLRQALTINPDYAEGYSNLGLTLKNSGQLEEAVESFQQALEIKPGLAGTHDNLGNALKELGRFDEAIASYRRALTIRPDLASAHYNLGKLYERLNQLELARGSIDSALTTAPHDPDINLAHAILLKREGKIEEAINTLERLVAGNVPAYTLSLIHNELGMLHDREGDTGNAFQHFSTANDLQARSETAASFSKDTFLAGIRHTDEILDADWVGTWTTVEDGQDHETPSFLVGFPRSGTTLLDQILDSHPSIQVMEERDALYETAAAIEKELGDYPDGIATLDTAAINKFREVYFEAVARYIDREAGTLLVDKYPFNICHMPLIARLFPKARIVLAMRHPCDVVLSNFMQNYIVNIAMANFFTLPDTAHCYGQVMGLWRKSVSLLPLDHHTVRYEALVDGLESEARRLFKFLDIEWDDAVLDYAAHAKQRGLINTPSYQSVTEPVYGRAKNRWKLYETELAPVLDELAPFIDAFGYEDRQDGIS